MPDTVHADPADKELTAAVEQEFHEASYAFQKLQSFIAYGGQMTASLQDVSRPSSHPTHPHLALLSARLSLRRCWLVAARFRRRTA